MKYASSLLFAGFIALSAPAWAQAGGVTAHRAEGTLKKIDAAAGTVLLAHEAIPALKWPPMTMSFDVRDRKLLQGLKPEQRVRFEFVIEGRRYVIVSFGANDKR